MGIAALVLGIVGLLGSFVPCLGMYAIPITVLAVIFGIVGMRAKGVEGQPPKGKGMAIAGLICGIIGTIIASYWIYVYTSVKSDFENDFRKGFREGIKKEMERKDR